MQQHGRNVTLYGERRPEEYREARTCERLIENERDSAELWRRLETERLTIPEMHGSLYDIIDSIQETVRRFPDEGSLEDIYAIMQTSVS